MASDGTDSTQTRIDEQIESLLFECLEADDATRAVESAAVANPNLADDLRRAYAEMVRFNLVGQRGSGGGIGRAGATGFSDSMPEQLGEYRLVERLGAGGMGVVFLARDDALQRTVALKLIRPEHVYMPGARERFQREVETIARLQHPGIVPIYGVGKADNMPYFTMQHIKGCSLSTALHTLRERKPIPDGRLLLTMVSEEAHTTIARPDTDSGSGSGIGGLSWPDTCVALTIQVASALHHAHERGVLHRDVKPSNILLTRDCRAMLVDFGLAWSADSDQRLTHSTSQLGSLPYLPPELIGGTTSDPNRAADIYSLGVTLYEMLALQNPFLGRNGEETRRNIMQAQPPKLRKAHRGVSWELETVCLKAMDPDPSKRYRTMLDLLRDLERVRDRESITARRASFARRARRWAQRHPSVVAALGVALVAAITVLAILGANDRSARIASERLREAAEVERYSALVSSADLEMRASGRPVRARQQLGQCREQDRRWEWFHLEYVTDQSAGLAQDVGAPVQDLCWAPDGGYVVTTQTKRLTHFEADGSERWRLEGHPIASVAFRATDAGFELLCGHLDGTLRVREPRNGDELAVFADDGAGERNELTSIAVSPDQRRVVTASSSGLISLWDAQSRVHIATLGQHDAPGHRVAISPDGKLVASGGFDRKLRVFDLDSRQQIAVWALPHWCYALAWTADSQHVLISDSQRIRSCSLASPGTEPRELDPNSHGSLGMSISPDGKLLAASVGRRVLHVYRLSTDGRVRLEPLARMVGHEGLLQFVRFDDESRRVLTGSSDHTARIWDVEQCAQMRVRAHRRQPSALAFADRDTIVSATSQGDLAATRRDGTVTPIRDADGGSPHDAAIVTLLPSRNGFVSIDASGAVVEWRCEERNWAVAGRRETDVGASCAVWADALAGERQAPLVLGCGDGRIAWIGDQRRTWQAHDTHLTDIAADGELLFSASVDGKLRKWNRDGELLQDVFDHPAWIAAIELSPDRRWIATSCADTIIRIFDVQTGELLQRLQGHGRVPLALATDTAGTRLISGGGYDNELRFWDPATGRCMLSIGRNSPVNALAFEPDSGSLAIAGRGGFLDILGIRPGGPRVFVDRDVPPDTITSPPGIGSHR